jgi:hypothetical protein
MSTSNQVRRFLTEVVGLPDDKAADKTGATLHRLFEDVQVQRAAGLRPEIADAAERKVAKLFLQEVLAEENAAVFRALRANGQLDLIQDKVRGFESDGNPEQRERQEDDALAVVLANVADQGAVNGLLNAQQYYEMLNMSDPGALADGVRRAGFGQTGEGDLDNRQRALSADERATVGAVAFAKRAGWARPESAETPDAPEETVAEHAGDYSPDQMERFVQKRNREDLHHVNRAIEDDGVVDLPTND